MKSFHFVAKVYHPESHKVCGTVANVVEVPKYFTLSEAMDECTNIVMQILQQNVQNGYTPEGAYMAVELFKYLGCDERNPGDLTIKQQFEIEQQEKAEKEAEALRVEHEVRHIESLIDNGIIDRIELDSFSDEHQRIIAKALARQVARKREALAQQASPAPVLDIESHDLQLVPDESPVSQIIDRAESKAIREEQHCHHMHMDRFICLDCGKDFSHLEKDGVTISE